LRRIAQELRAVAVHQDLPGDHAQVARFAGLEKRVHRFLVHGAVDHRGGGPAAQQLVEEELGDLAPVRRIGEPALGREGVALQPGQQARRRRGDHVGLREMQVGVDKAGHDQLAAVVDDVGPLGQRLGQLRVIAGGVDLVAVDQQQAVLMP
jgi:hypothetical protein